MAGIVARAARFGIVAVETLLLAKLERWSALEEKAKAAGGSAA